MRVRWRGSRLWPAVLALLCATGLAACATGSLNKPISGTTATTGPLTVATNLSAYPVSDAIGVTVSNASSSDYYSLSGKSACVIIQLERYDTLKAVWQPVDACQSQDVAQSYTIAKGSQQQFTLAPNSSADPNAWQPGLYRVTVIYSTNADGATNAQEARSAAFNVR